LEDRTLDFSTKFQVSLPLPTRTTKNILEKDSFFLSDTRSIKMGMEEVESLDRALSSLHPYVWVRAREGRDSKGGIVVIRKDHSPHLNYKDWSRKTDELAYYSPWDRSITLHHLQEQPYARLDSV